MKARFQLARRIAFLLAFAGVFGGAGWCQGVVSSPAKCSDVGSLHLELARVYQKLHMTNQATQQFNLCKTTISTGSSSANDNLDFVRPH